MAKLKDFTSKPKGKQDYKPPTQTVVDAKKLEEENKQHREAREKIRDEVGDLRALTEELKKKIAELEAEKEFAEKELEKVSSDVNPLKVRAKKFEYYLQASEKYLSRQEVEQIQTERNLQARKDRENNVENYKSLGRPTDKKEDVYYVKLGGMVPFETRRRFMMGHAKHVRGFLSQDAFLDAAINFYMDKLGIERYEDL